MPKSFTRRFLRAVPLADLIESRDGPGNNFDLIRLIAASLVLVSHAFPLSGDKSAIEPLARWTGGQDTFGGFAVCTFFFVSGFLVTRSLDRRSLIAFAAARALRILPGLAVAVTLCALVLGPMATSLSTHDYFTDRQFAAYFRNILLQMHFNLPGVFAHNAMQAVNGSLWTLKFEVTMYALLPLVFWSARLVSRHILLAGLALLIGLRHFYLQGPAIDGYFTYYYIHLGQFFLAGTIGYIYRDMIRLSPAAALICVGIEIAAAITGGFSLARLLAGSYVLLWLAYAAPKIKDPITAHGDLSYGVYIYAFPMQQLVAERFGWGATWLGNIALSLPLTFALAALSWRFVEKPALGMRRSITAFLDERTGLALERLMSSLPLYRALRRFRRFAQETASLERSAIHAPAGPRAPRAAQSLELERMKESA